MNSTPQGTPGQGGMPGQGFQGRPGGFGRPPGAGRNPFFRVLMIGGPFAVLFAIVTLLILAICFYKIFKKAGFNGLLGLLMLIPIVNWGMMLYFAFADWPIQHQLNEFKKKVAAFTASQPAEAAEPVVAAPAETPATS